MDHDKATEQVRNQNAFDMGSNCGDTNSEAESISEEERVRRLFAVCDADGDGYIDRYSLNYSVVYCESHLTSYCFSTVKIWLVPYKNWVWRGPSM